MLRSTKVGASYFTLPIIKDSILGVYDLAQILSWRAYTCYRTQRSLLSPQGLWRHRHGRTFGAHRGAGLLCIWVTSLAAPAMADTGGVGGLVSQPLGPSGGLNYVYLIELVVCVIL